VTKKKKEKIYIYENSIRHNQTIREEGDDNSRSDNKPLPHPSRASVFNFAACGLLWMTSCLRACSSLARFINPSSCSEREREREGIFNYFKTVWRDRENVSKPVSKKRVLVRKCLWRRPNDHSKLSLFLAIYRAIVS
jgi:hypothetical protein